MQRACGKCAFYHVEELGAWTQMGQCRRYAPRPVLYDCNRDTKGPHDGVDVGWPRVLDEDFCGDFEGRAQ
jgi:hypothetical protein